MGRREKPRWSVWWINGEKCEIELKGGICGKEGDIEMEGRWRNGGQVKQEWKGMEKDERGVMWRGKQRRRREGRKGRRR